MSRDTYHRSVEYTLVKGRFAIVTGTATSLFLLTVILTGSLGRMDALVAGWNQRVEKIEKVGGVFGWKGLGEMRTAV